MQNLNGLLSELHCNEKTLAEPASVVFRKNFGDRLFDYNLHVAIGVFCQVGLFPHSMVISKSKARFTINNWQVSDRDVPCMMVRLHLNTPIGMLKDFRSTAAPVLDAEQSSGLSLIHI